MPENVAAAAVSAATAALASRDGGGVPVHVGARRPLGNRVAPRNVDAKRQFFGLGPDVALHARCRTYDSDPAHDHHMSALVPVSVEPDPRTHSYSTDEEYHGVPDFGGFGSLDLSLFGYYN
jgi:hypothetical protein